MTDRQRIIAIIAIICFVAVLVASMAAGAIRTDKSNSVPPATEYESVAKWAADTTIPIIGVHCIGQMCTARTRDGIFSLVCDVRGSGCYIERTHY